MKQLHREDGVSGVVSQATPETPTNTGNSARYVIPVIDMRGMTPDERAAVFFSRCNREVGENFREWLIAAAIAQRNTPAPVGQLADTPILESA